MDGVTLFNICPHGDNRGELYALEYQKELPFVIRRVYYICNVPGSNIKRGFHAHKKLRQAIICLGGSCSITVDNGKIKEIYLLDKPNKLLILDAGLWREINNFSANATLVVLASDVYDENDYIRDYHEFILWRGGQK